MLKNKPFQTTKLEEDRTDDLLKIRLNKSERLELEEWKSIIDETKDSTAIKMALSWAHGDLKEKAKGRYRIKMFRKKH